MMQPAQCHYNKTYRHLLLDFISFSHYKTQIKEELSQLENEQSMYLRENHLICTL